MKKLFILAIVVLGTNFATFAQSETDYIKTFRLKSSSTQIAQDLTVWFDEGDDFCASNFVSAGVVRTFSLNRSTGQIYIQSGDDAAFPQGSPITGRLLIGLNTTFDRTDFERLDRTSSRGITTNRDIASKNADGTFTIN